MRPVDGAQVVPVRRPPGAMISCKTDATLRQLPELDVSFRLPLLISRRLCLCLCLLAAQPLAARAEVPRPGTAREVVQLLAAALREKHPEATVTYTAIGANPVIRSGPNRLYVTELTAQLQSEPDNAKREALFAVALDSLINGHKAKPRPAPPWGEDFMPVLNGRHCFPVQPEFEFAPGLRAQWGCAGASELRRIGKDVPDVVAKAGRNLSAAMAKLTPRRVPGTRITEIRSYVAPGLLLQSSYWSLRVRPGERVVAAIPTQGLFLWVTDPDAAELAKLRALTEAAFAKNRFMKLSPGLFELSGTRTWTTPGWSGPQIWQTPDWQILAP